MSRLPALLLKQMSEHQRALHNDIVASRGPGIINPDGSLQGPFDVLLRSPQLGEAIQATGAEIRFEGTLKPAMREVAILICAQHWRANFEWWTHKKIAIAEGVQEQIITSIYEGRAPDHAEYSIVHTFLTELNQNGRVSDQAYNSTHELLGEETTVELTMLSGYYALISQLLNVFDCPLPEGEAIPFA